MTFDRPKKTTKKSSKVRLDAELVRRGLVEDIRAAQGVIMAGDVVVDDQRTDKPGAVISDAAVIRMREDGKYVSRGGDKLAAAIADFGLSEAFKQQVVLDVGASTGGFTDCCLQMGAARAITVEVGTNQLAWKLRNDPRVSCFEKTDIRDFVLDSAHPPINWVVADISFNSIARMLEDIVRIAPDAHMLLLIKPQFELPPERVPAAGVVQSDEDRQLALNLAEKALKEAGIDVLDKKDARVAGRAGNREIFVYARSRRV